MGLTANVVAEAPILSAWGNEIRDRTIQNFATAAERAAQWTAPPEGAASYLRDVDRLEIYDGTSWRVPGRAFAQIIRTAGDHVINSATWQTVFTGLDLTLPAVAGDLIEVCPNFMCGAEATDFAFDFIFVASSLNLSRHAAEDPIGYGAGGWRGEPGVFSSIAGSLYCPVAAGDISAGSVTLRLRVRSPGGAVAKTIKAIVTQPLIISARNLGPDVG